MVDERIDTIADAWYRVIRPAAANLVNRSEARRLVERLAQRIVELLTREGGYDPDDVDALAEQLLALQLSPDDLGKLGQVLVRELAEAPPPEGARALPTPPSRLVGDLMAATLRRRESTILEQQEQMRRAYATALRRAERQLRVMDAAVECAITAVALWTLDGELTYVNPAFLTMWEQDQHDAIVGKPVSTLWTDDPPYETIRTSVEQAGGWIGKLKAVRGDGSSFTVMLSASLVEPDRGTPPFVIGCFVDMTYREKLSRMLWRRVDRLKALQRVDRGILAATGPEEIAQAALQHIRQLIPCRRASVTLVMPEDDRFRFLAAIPASSYRSLENDDDLSLTGFEEAMGVLARDEIYVIGSPSGLPRETAIPDIAPDEGPVRYVLVPLQAEGELLGSLNIVLPEGGSLSDRHATIAREVADSLAVAIRHAQMAQAIAEHRERLQDLTARLARVDEAKRRRLARDLHDQIGQKLTALGINLNVVKAHLEPASAPRLTSRLDDSLELLKETTDRVRRVIADLRPPMLDDYGLLATLRWCGERLEDRADVDVVVLGEEPDPRLGSPVEEALVRITQEALTNVLKHAEASRVTITLSEDEESVRLEISDDGQGFAAEEIDRRDGHWGMVTIVERAEAVGGTCRVESRPGEGTTVIVEISR